MLHTQDANDVSAACRCHKQAATDVMHFATVDQEDSAVPTDAKASKVTVVVALKDLTTDFTVLVEPVAKEKADGQCSDLKGSASLSKTQQNSTTTQGAKGNRSLTNEVRLQVNPDIPRDVYKFSLEEVAEAEQEWSATLIGVLIGKPITFNAMTEFIKSCWQVKQPKLYLKNNGIWVIKFKSMEDRRWVLTNGPWMIDGHKSFILKEWSTGMSIDWSSFASVPVWVKVLDIDPIFLSSKRMLEVIGNMIGKPISSDHISYEVEKLSYARLLVEVTLEDLKRKEVVLQSYDGKIYKHRVEFEWIPWNCSICNIFGHSMRFCSHKETEMDESGRSKKVPMTYKDVAAGNGKSMDTASVAAGMERNSMVKASANSQDKIDKWNFRKSTTGTMVCK